MAAPQGQTLDELLKSHTQPGELYERLVEGKVRCFACGHRCLIPDGRDGVCRVRFNRGGTLYVPHGYVGVLQCDPIEKKPFFHARPGTDAFSFGMLGCDLHCGYCFSPTTRIATSEGMLPIRDIVSTQRSLEVYTHAGVQQKVTAFFERPYHGQLLKVKPAHLPAIECTPEHPFLTRLRPDRHPASRLEYLAAGQLTMNHCLAIPKRYDFSEDVVLDTRAVLEPWLLNYRVPYAIPAELIERILNLTAKGNSSAAIADAVGKSASHVRHLRSAARRGVRLTTRRVQVIEEAGRVRLSKEHAPGIPSALPVDEALAELLGWYCAEGSVSASRGRVHAASLNFAFGKSEQHQAERVCQLLGDVFGVQAHYVKRPTTLAVATGKTSLALLCKALCGVGATGKRVPALLFRAKASVVRSFLNAYVAGDGYRAPDGQIRISTVSEELAWGIAWLVQKLGYLPQSYRYRQATQRTLLGRPITQAPWVFLVRWYETPRQRQHVWEDETYRYVLIKDIEPFDYDGPVYNLEVETHHTYLANGVAVHNCQNWLTSQSLRDPSAGAPPMVATPSQLVELAARHGASTVASTYNEPLITSEWAVAVFREAKARGFKTAYISNGNGTEEVLQYLKPWVDLYKVDLKGFDDKHYRELGGQLEAVKWTIRRLYELRFWLEVVTLIVPGFNDGDDELRQIAEFLASISPDIPWHVTAFHPDYKMQDRGGTPAETLIRAAELGQRAGLRYVYAGNLPGQVGPYEHTACPSCHMLLIERFGYQIRQDRLSGRGRCPACQTVIPGVWQ